MKDDQGQTRKDVRTREITIAVVFAVFVAIGAWTVAVPALQQDSKPVDGEREQPPADQAKPTPPASGP